MFFLGFIGFYWVLLGFFVFFWVFFIFFIINLVIFDKIVLFSPFRFSARLLRIKLKLGTYYILTNYLGYSLFQSLFVFKIPMPPDSGRKKDGVWCEVKAAENDQKKVVCMHCDGMI